MKKLLLISISFPFVFLAQSQNINSGEIYFLSDIYENTAVWHEDTNGGWWDNIDEHNYVEFSEYDVATSTLTSQTLDTSITDHLGADLSCFDPTTNMLYSIVECYDDCDTLYMGALNVITGNIALIPLGENSNTGNTVSVNGSLGDTSYMDYSEGLTMECWNNKIYFLSDIYENTAVWHEDTNGGWWDNIDEHNYVEFSEYDVATSTLTSQTLDTSITDHLGADLSCFDPTTNMLYSIVECYDDCDTLYMGALNVITGNIALIPLGENSNTGNTVSVNGSLGDTSYMDYSENRTMEVGYDLPVDSIMNIINCNSYSWNGNIYNSSGTYVYTTKNSIFLDSTVTLDLTINSILSSINQSGDNLSAVTTPVGLTANWYNIQTDNGDSRIWLMEEDATSFTPTFDCSYFIVVSDNGCTDTSEIYSYGENAARIGSFTTSPNPTTGLINVKFDNPKNQFVELELISNNGSKLDEFITVDNNLNIDLSNYPSGTYYLYFNSENAVQGCRLEEVQRISTKIILNK